MEPTVYRISAVLAGQSASVSVLGRDAAGRELQLELPPEQARALQAGQLLILSWSAHAIPELDPASAPEPTLPEPAAEAPPTTPAATSSTSPLATPRACGCDEEEVFRMLGLG